MRQQVSSPEEIARHIAKAGAEDIELMLAHLAEKWAGFCESPIEVTLLTALTFSDVYSSGDASSGYDLIVSKEAPSSDSHAITIVPQYRWQSYRIDFAIFAPKTPAPDVFVECDGFMFHERTPEQASRDRFRDRTIQQMGIPIIRFLGREIYRDPFGCALQILEFLGRRRST